MRTTLSDPHTRTVLMPGAADLDSFARELSDRYRLDREIGRGGMATVWLAHDLRHDRSVALKVVRRELGAVLGRERFLHEIRLTARLQHPHILPLLDSGEAAGLLWYTMPFVDGESLRQRLERARTLPVRDAVVIASQVAEALAHAHAKGVVHRDIKPENILLADGGALVADFGIARVVGAVADQRLTGTGLALGTPAYMSPEQAVGERELDGRTDVYALGCTLFEMLCGEAPFADGAMSAILARRLTEPAPSARARRAEVPATVEVALARALAREPSARFATATAFAEALAPAATPLATTAAPVRARRRPLGTLSLGAMLAVAVLGVFLVAQRRRPRAVAPDPDLVAIAPFETLDPSLDVWRDGMADVLSRYLDGAGPLRTVAPSTVIRRWRGRSDRASAEAFSRTTGAGVVVVGEVTSASRDSVRLRASVVTVADGRADDVEVSGSADRIGQLADSLGRGILLALGRHRPIAAVAGSPLTATSLPALKAFLRGEQFYRRSQFDSALVQFQRAIEADSTFALAHQRMVVILWFNPRTASAYRTIEYYAMHALSGASSLPARDSLLVVGVGCMLGTAWVHGESRVLGAMERYRCADSTARAATTRFPSDPEAWYLLGENRFHSASALGATPSDQFAPFQRTIELDSTFTPVYEHAIDLALAAGRPELATRFARTAVALAGSEQQGERYRLVHVLLDPGLYGTASAESLVAHATTMVLWNALTDLRQADDSAQAAVRVARSLYSAFHDTVGAVPWTIDSVQLRRTLANTLSRRGRLREAAALVRHDTPAGFQNPYYALALVGALPAEEVDDAMRRLSLAPISPIWYHNVNRWTRMLGWWRERRDTAALRRAAALLTRSIRHADPALDRATAQRLVQQADAYAALATGDSATAIKLLMSLADSTCFADESCIEPRVTVARLLVARGRLEEGARWMDQWSHQQEGLLSTMMRLERGRLAEHLHDRSTAIAEYSRVVRMWHVADASLQPYVAEARDGLRRLTAEAGPR